jgi:hypothetical protein
MRRIIAAIAVPAAAVVVLAGCMPRPAGAMESQQREIADVTSVVLDSAGDLTITEGEPSLVIHAGSRVIDSLTSRVDGGELVLGTDRRIMPFGPGQVRYELTLPSLESLRVNGAGDVRTEVSGDDLTIEISGTGDVGVEDIDAGEVTVRIDGAGEVELDGRADRLDVSVNGTGDVEAEQLAVVDASVEIDGSGDATVNASDTLDVRISGIGDVRYAGDPAITRRIDGVGEVRPV